MTERNGEWEWVEHSHHGEIVVSTHRPEVTCVPNILNVFPVIVRDVGVRQLRLEGLLGWNLCFIHLREAVVYPSAYTPFRPRRRNSPVSSPMNFFEGA